MNQQILLIHKLHFSWAWTLYLGVKYLQKKLNWQFAQLPFSFHSKVISPEKKTNKPPFILFWTKTSPMFSKLLFSFFETKIWNFKSKLTWLSNAFHSFFLLNPNNSNSNNYFDTVLVFQWKTVSVNHMPHLLFPALYLLYSLYLFL